MIPVFVDDGLMANLYIRKSKFLRYWMAKCRRRHTVEYLARLIERNESKIAWVDILLYSFDGTDALYFVELVCLNKKPGILNYHASVETDKYGKAKLY